MSDDEKQEEPELGPLERAALHGTYRESIEVLIGIIAHEIEGNRCKNCLMTQMRTGEFSALALRFQKLLEERESLPSETSKSQQDKDREAGVVNLAYFQQQLGHGVPDTADPAHSHKGTKKAPRQQGGRRRSG